MWPSLRRRPRALLSQLPFTRRHLAKAKDKRAAANDGDHTSSTTNTRAPTGRGRRRKGRAANRPPSTSEKKHYLYLVFPENKDGFCIHKVDMDAGPTTDPELLPEPPVLRVEGQNIYNNFGVLGSLLIGMGIGTREPADDDKRSDGDTLTFDAKTGTLAIMPDLPVGLLKPGAVASVPVGNFLYVFEYGSRLYRLKLLDGTDGGKDGDERWTCYWEGSRRWRWSADHHRLPFYGFSVRAHALHPRARAFLVSVGRRVAFSYNTASYRWTRHDGWELPFVGEAHYDAGLRAWLGLHGDSDDDMLEPDGYLCSCDVPHLGRRAAPGWKLGKERLFREDPGRHVCAKLVRMGGGDDDGRFCLVEVLKLEADDGGDGYSFDKCDECVLRLTTFSVKYDGDGELITTARRPTRSFIMPTYWRRSDFQAFWV